MTNKNSARPPLRHPGPGAVWAPRMTVPLILAAALAGLLAACERDSQERGTVRKAEVGRVPVSAQRPGDPERGRDAFLNRAVVTCGIPYRIYAQVRRDAQEEGVPLLQGRTGRNANLPYSLTAHVASSGVELVTTNCLGCHAATINGRLIIGLGNERLDMTVDPLLAVEATGAVTMSDAERAEWRRWADRITAIADYGITETVGVNSADNLTLALMAHRDPKTLAWSSKPLIEPPPRPPLPVSVPPLWGLGKKHALFYSAQGRGDHARHMALASAACVDSVTEAAAIDAWMVDVRAYLASLTPPAYPFRVDAALAERGKYLFERNCKDCHGTYGPNARYPNKVIALGKVKTDPMLARWTYTGADRFLTWLAESFYGELVQTAPALGYIAPPLDGVWATAPYLHNGAVPNLEFLLSSGERPKYWELTPAGETQPSYDQARVGWDYRAREYGKDGAMSWDERNRIYDATQPGYGNQGHTFGDDLDAAERAALLEYLKTL
jgi:cytochrome c5